MTVPMGRLGYLFSSHYRKIFPQTRADMQMHLWPSVQILDAERPILGGNNCSLLCTLLGVS